MSEDRGNSRERISPTNSAQSSTAAAPALATQAVLKVRLLPDGEFREIRHLGWKGRDLKIDLGSQDFALGAPLEIESGSMLYWGELSERRGSTGTVTVEHSLDCAAVVSDRDHWA